MISARTGTGLVSGSHWSHDKEGRCIKLVDFVPFVCLYSAYLELIRWFDIMAGFVESSGLFE